VVALSIFGGGLSSVLSDHSGWDLIDLCAARCAIFTKHIERPELNLTAPLQKGVFPDGRELIGTAKNIKVFSFLCRTVVLLSIH
jgi:hypothetical protein